MAVLPPYVLDQLYASLTPLTTRLSEVWVKAQTAWMPDDIKKVWLSNLTQASQAIQNASIEGRMGQLLAMGDVTVQQWSMGPESAADLVEFVAREVGMSSYSIRRLWREVVVPTVTQVVDHVQQLPKLALDWGPFVIGGAGLLWLWLNFGGRRTPRALSGYRRKRRNR